MNYKSIFCWCTILMLVVLRIAIGWHFFNEGRDHYFDDKWSSKGFLSAAVGPFAQHAKSTLPGNHGWDALVGQPFTPEQYTEARNWYNEPEAKKQTSAKLEELKKSWAAKENAKTSKEPKQPEPTIIDPEYPLYGNPIYGAWAKQVRDDWLSMLKNHSAHYGWKETTVAEVAPKPAEPKADEPKKEPAKQSEPAAEKQDTPSKPAEPAKESQSRNGEERFDGTEARFVAAAEKKDDKAAAEARPTGIPAGEEYAYAYAKLIRYLKLLEQKLAGKEKEIYEYRSELARLRLMESQPYAANLPYEKTRIDNKRKELTGTSNGLINDLMGLDQGYRAILQKAGANTPNKPPYQMPEPRYVQSDRYIPIFLMICGGCLIVGLFTRLAAFGCALFLLSVVLLQPFWIDGAQPTYYQWIELIGCLVLATTGVGRYLGLDFFLHWFFGGSKSAK